MALRFARKLRTAVLTGVALALVGATVSCAPTPQAAPATIQVPDDAPTIADAIERAQPGDLVLIGAGVYHEAVRVDTPDLTIRGVDRNETVIDAEGSNPYGIVVTADGVRVENLTVRNAAFYGVLVTGMHGEDGEPAARGSAGYTVLDPESFPPVERFRIDHVTASNNGLYGIYAFNSRVGVITDSYASGSADSGIYVGQCEACDILVSGNVAQHNAIGFENANASDSVTLVSNRFTDNRVGATLISSYQEAFVPQRANTLVGNLFANNNTSESPAHAEGAFGVGVGISGGQDNLLQRNTVADHVVAGIALQSVEDVPASGNRFDANSFARNSTDLANTSEARTPALANCVVGDVSQLTTLPLSLGAALTVPSCETEQPTIEHSALNAVTVPPGKSFLQVKAPPKQPQLVSAELLEIVPKPLPASITVPDLDTIVAPGLDLLAERAHVS